MDTFLRGLIAALVVLVGAATSERVWAQECHAKSYYVNQCQASAATKPTKPTVGNYTWSYTCEDQDPSNASYADIMLVQTRSDNGLRADLGHAKGYICAQTNPCADQGDMSGAFAGSLSAGASLCARQPDGVTGCAMTFTPDSPPYLNRAGTQWGTHGTYKKTGGTCSPTGTNAAPPPAPPKSCGGVSCYDSAGDKYCMVNSSGAQVCVSGADGRKPGGACASGGDATLCAGAPQPPKPPAPPQSPISDPPTETKGGDAFTHGSNGAGGTSPGAGNITVTTGAYGAGGSPTGSGQVAGNDGPPGASTSGLPGGGGTGDGEGDKGDETGASGGGDCSNAPAVTGSPALAMVARQAWETRCAAEKVHKDLAGDGTSTPGDITTPSGKSAWVDTPASGDAVADNANKGSYDSTGMGFSTACPMHDLQVPLWDGRSFSIPFSKGCDIGVWIRALVIAFALFAAAKITVGGSN